MIKLILSLLFITYFNFSCMDYDASYNISSKSTSNLSTDPDPDPISDDDDDGGGGETDLQNLYAVTYADNRFVAVGNG